MANEYGHDSHADAATRQDQHLGTLSSLVKVPVHRKTIIQKKVLSKEMLDVVILHMNIFFLCLINRF